MIGHCRAFASLFYIVRIKSEMFDFKSYTNNLFWAGYISHNNWFKNYCQRSWSSNIMVSSI